MLIWNRIKTYAGIAVGAIGAAALTVLYVMFRIERGRADEAEAEARQAKQAEAIHEANEQHASEVQYATTETQREIDAMPDAGTQAIGRAKSGTAAGWLRRNANRDDSKTSD